ncbi:MAG: gamma-glutamyltransferase [Acidimicrobiales bacterium]
MTFTTRPEIVGTFGAVASTHWIASAVGMSVLERGGNAFDAAVAAAFVLHVVEPHMNGIGGDAVIMVQRREDALPTVVCGQGCAPARATIREYEQRGLDRIPAEGLLAAVVPGAFGAWMAMLRDYGTITLADALAPAIDYARRGVPLHAGAADSIARSAGKFNEQWPSSAEEFLANGRPLRANQLLRRPRYADMLERVVREGAGATRGAQIDAAIDAFYRGFVAEHIGDFLAHEDALLAPDDMAAWSPAFESPITYGYRGWTVCKAPTWTQGPVLLQALALLEGFTIAGPDAGHPDSVHLMVEAMKLALADREVWYGDPAFFDVPMRDLLDREYNAARRQLIDESASAALRPGSPGGRTPVVPRYDTGGRGSEPLAAANAASAARAAMPSPAREGDTCHLDVVDRWGNIVAATPSGGWLTSSPVIPGLGFPLGTRGQMFWLQEGLASSLRPGARPRTTLTPSVALGPDGTRMAFGTPGGDSQDQWCLQFFVNVVDRGMNLQAAIDAPYFQTNHAPDSFFPRRAEPLRLLAEDRFAASTLADLTRRGHHVVSAGSWTLGRNCVTQWDGDGACVRAAASARHQQAYALGR